MNTLVWIVFIGCIAQSALGQQAEMIWKTDAVFAGPESVAYDAERNLLYVSNFKQSPRDTLSTDQFISKVRLSGEILDLHWITGVYEPMGLTLFHDRLYIVERSGVAVADPESGHILRRTRINHKGALNDIAAGPDGTLYISESDTDTIYAIRDDSVFTWFSGSQISHPNGLLAREDRLLIAANRDSSLVAVYFDSMTTSVVAQLKSGIIDGIQSYDRDYLLSYFGGSLYRVTEQGLVTEVLTSNDMNIADFAYIEQQKLLIIPALWQHRLVAYRLHP